MRTQVPRACPIPRVSWRLIAVAAGILAGAGLALAQGPLNPDLEDGQLGKLPTGWFLPQPSADAGYSAELTEDGPRSGKRCAVLGRTAAAPPRGFGNLMQSFDAAPFRGQRVRFKAAARS